MKRIISPAFIMLIACFSLHGCGNNIQTKWIGKVAIQKAANETLTILINPCGAPLTEVRFAATSPGQRFAKTVILDSAHTSPFEISYSLSPSSTDSFPIFTQEIGEFDIHSVAVGADTRTQSVLATREEVLRLEDGELITGMHTITSVEKFNKCESTFEK